MKPNPNAFFPAQKNALKPTTSTPPTFGLGKDEEATYKGVKIQVNFSLIDPEVANLPKEKPPVFPCPYRPKVIPDPE